jgi:hypothetical protein
MRMLPLVVVAASCSLLIPAAARAQGLAEAAAKEKARRKGLTPSKVYTEDDLRRAGAAAPPASASATESSTASDDGEAAASKDDATKETATGAGKTGAKPKTDDELRAEREKDWHDRLAKAEAEVGRLKADIASLESMLGDMSQNLYSSSRAAQMNRLEEDKKQLATAEQKVADLQEEGRRNSFR